MAGKKKDTRLTEKQKVELCAKYATGLSFEDLAKIYGCDKSTCKRIVDKHPEFATQCQEYQKKIEAEAMQTMDEYIQSKQGKVQSLIEQIMNSLEEVDFTEESVRDRVGAIKILREAFVPKYEPIAKETTANEPITFVEVEHGENRDK